MSRVYRAWRCNESSERGPQFTQSRKQEQCSQTKNTGSLQPINFPLRLCLWNAANLHRRAPSGWGDFPLPPTASWSFYASHLELSATFPTTIPPPEKEKRKKKTLKARRQRRDLPIMHRECLSRVHIWPVRRGRRAQTMDRSEFRQRTRKAWRGFVFFFPRSNALLRMRCLSLSCQHVQIKSQARRDHVQSTSTSRTKHVQSAYTTSPHHIQQPSADWSFKSKKLVLAAAGEGRPLMTSGGSRVLAFDGAFW